MKNEIESGVKAFIEEALRVDGSLAPGDDLPIAVLAGSGEQTIEETDPAIIVLVEDYPVVTYNLGRAELIVIVSSPRAKGKKTGHETWIDFIRRIFPPAIPPALPVNAAHLSEYLEAASDDLISGRGYHVESHEPADEDTRWNHHTRIALGIMVDASTPLESVGLISVV